MIKFLYKKFNFHITILVLIFFLCHKSYATNFSIKELSYEDVKIYYLYDNFLPIIDIKLAFKNRGTSYVNEELEGINSIVSYLTNNLLFLGDKRAEISRKINASNIKISFDNDIENFYISLRFLKKDIEFVTEILMLFFNDAKIKDNDIDQAKTYLNYVKADSYLNSNFIAKMNLKKSYFKEEYARDGFMNYQEGKFINKKSIIDFINSLKFKDNISLSIVGDIQIKKIDELMHNIFGAFTAKSNIENKSVKIHNFKHKEFQLSGYDQVIFNSIIKGFPRDDDDFYKFYLFNYLFGASGRNSYIGRILREEEGLTYSGSSDISFLNNETFLITNFATDKNKFTDAEIIANKIYEDIKNHKFTENELNIAKKHLIGKYNIIFSSNSIIAGFLLRLNMNDLPITYINDRNNFIEAVNIEDIIDVQKRLFSSGDFAKIVTGDIK